MEKNVPVESAGTQKDTTTEEDGTYPEDIAGLLRRGVLREKSKNDYSYLREEKQMDSKQSMGAAAENFSVIGARMLDIALQRGIEAGIKEAMSYLAEEKEKAYKSRYDRRLRNTRLLL